ncbi:MAG: LirA/MavJ family T4SS effector [Pseudomonadota bacterium]
MNRNRAVFFSIGMFFSLLTANIACKTEIKNQSEELSANGGYENYNRLPETACLAPSRAFDEMNPENNLEFAERENGAPDTAEVTDDALSFLIQSQLTSCSTEIASIIEKPEGTSFGLANVNLPAVWKNTSVAFTKLKGTLKQLRVFYANGRSLVLTISKARKSQLLSSLDRIKLFPNSNRVAKYTGPRIVTSEVASANRYALIMRSLEKNRSEQFVKFKAYLASSEFAAIKINYNNYDIESNDPNIVKGIESIFDLVSDPKAVFSQIQNLEFDVAKRMATKGESMEDALEAILTATEKKHKFLSAFDLQTSLTQDDLKKPALFRDKFFKPGSSHGVQIHRIQWNIIMRHLDENPFLKNKINAAQLYVKFGEGIPSKGITGKTPNWADAWNDLFDAFGQDLGCPEKWRGVLTQFLPTLAGWP